MTEIPGYVRKSALPAKPKHRARVTFGVPLCHRVNWRCRTRRPARALVGLAVPGVSAQPRKPKIAKNLESRGEIGPFAALFRFAGRRLVAAENQLSKETPVQNGVSSLAASLPFLERPKISPRLRILGRFCPISVRGVPQGPKLRRRPRIAAPNWQPNHD